MGSKTKKTAAYIDLLISEKGGYSKKALLELGVPWPPKKGWKRALIAASHAQAHGKSKKPVCASPHRKSGAGDFYSSWEWKQVRYEALKMHGNRCMCCGWEPMQGNKGRLCVDHIKPRSKFPKLALSLSNLQVLCNSCNMGKSNKHTDDFRESWHGDDEAETFWMDAAFSQTMQ